jgi:diguanylate cyclase (GGDEF)-like protein
MAQTSVITHRYAIERLELLRELEAAKVDAEELARTDALTGLLNRRAVMEVARALFEGALRARSPLSVIILDIDHFKAINDSHGHPVGDAAIAAVAATMERVKRGGDIAGRIGGEEFLLVLPHTRGDEAVTVAERLRKAIPGSAPRVEEGVLGLTCSLGCTEVDAGDTSLMALVQRADAALYAAKKSGRNRTCSAAPSPSELRLRPASS